MNTSLKTLAIVLLSACLSLTAQAGEGKKEKRKGKMTERIISHLQLDEGRANEVRIILKESRDARKELKEKRGEEAKALRAQTKEKMAAVLTSDEMKSLAEFKKKNRKKGKKAMNKKKKYRKNKTDV